MMNQLSAAHKCDFLEEIEYDYYLVFSLLISEEIAKLNVFSFISVCFFQRIFCDESLLPK